MNPRIVEQYARKMGRESGRPVGVEEAEADIHRVIRQVARGLAPKYVFGYHNRSDIEQDAFVLALEVLEKEVYDPGRPLENFLYVHIRRRLGNNIRKSYYRGEPPCTCCDPVNPPPEPCKKWLDWHRRNTSKQNLMRPLDVSTVNDEHEPRMASPSSAVEDASMNEILSRIDRLLPVDLRADYLRMREQVMIPKVRRQRVREAILAILSPGEVADA
jgi:hypothetical protein